MSTGINPPPGRGIIYAKDIRNMTGFTMATAWKMLRRIRSILGKPPGTLITIEEYCLCTNMDYDFVRSFIR